MINHIYTRDDLYVKCNIFFELYLYCVHDKRSRLHRKYICINQQFKFGLRRFQYYICYEIVYIAMTTSSILVYCFNGTIYQISILIGLPTMKVFCFQILRKRTFLRSDQQYFSYSFIFTIFFISMDLVNIDFYLKYTF